MLCTYGPEQIPLIWPSMEPYIERALDRGSSWTLPDVYRGLKDSKLQLWTYEDPKLQAVMVTGIYDRTCYLITLSGRNFKKWIDFYPIVERWAIEEGCDSIVIQGRKGWSKLLGFPIVGKDELGLYILRRDLCQTHSVQKPQNTEIAPGSPRSERQAS